MNILQEALARKGLTYKEAIRRVPYHAFFKQWHGKRSIGPKSAILYERVLGIPRSELRPDLWPPEDVTPAGSAE